jgi:hypothetical protein
MNSVQKDQDPLSIDVSKIPAKKQIIKSKINIIFNIYRGKH